LRTIGASQGEATSVCARGVGGAPRLLRFSLRSMARNEGRGRLPIQITYT
jgi:hypothetical protein